MKKTAFITLILTLAMLFTSNVLSADYLNDAKQYLEKGDYKAATIQLKNQLKQYPEDIQSRYLLGTIYLENGDLKSAEKELRKAYQYDKNDEKDEKVQLEYAKTLLLLKDYDKVKLILAQPFIDNDHESERLMTIGYTFLNEQKIAEAKDYFYQAEKVKDKLNVQIGFVKIALLEKDVKTAEKIIAGILTQAPDNQETLLLKARLAAGLGQYQQALSIYNDLLVKKPDDLILLLNRADTKYSLKDYKGVEEDLNTVLTSNENIPQANYLMALAKYDQEDFSSAELYARKVLNVMPKNYQAMYIIAKADVKLGRLNQADKYFNQYLFQYPDDLDVHYSLARLYILKKETGQALFILESIGQDARDKNPKILLLLGTVYLMADEKEKAVDAVKRAKTLWPEDPLVSEALVKVYLFSGDLDNAIKELEKLDAAKTENKKVQYLLIMSYIKDKRYKKAKALIDKLVKISPDDSNLYTFYGDIEFIDNNQQLAVQSYQKALALDEKFIPAYLGLSKIAFLNKQFEQADAYFKKILAIDVQYINAYIGRADMNEQMGNTHLAEQVLKEAINKVTGDQDKELKASNALAKLYIKHNQKGELSKLGMDLVKKYPNKTPVLSLQAKILIANGEKKQAQLILSKIIYQEPKDIKHRLQLAALLLENNQQQSVFDLLDEILEINPAHQETVFLKSSLLIENSQFEELADFLNNTLKVDKNNINLVYQLAVQAQKQGKYKLAAECYKILLQHRPENTVILNNLAWVYSEQDNPEALLLARKAYDKSPQSAAIADTYGYILLKHDKIKEGINILESAAALDSNDKDIRYHLAWGYYLAGNRQKTHRILEKILRPEHYFSEQENAKLLLKKLNSH